MPIQKHHTPENTDDVTFSVWILPDVEDQPTKYTGVADVLKLPNGEIKIAHHDGVTDSRTGEVIRLRQEGLDG